MQKVRDFELFEEKSTTTARRQKKKKKMKRIIAVLFFSLIFAVATASAQKNYCFENDGLKLKQIISLTATGNKIEGTMESGTYETENMETFDFTGTKTGNILNIKFAATSPYELAPGTKKIAWIFLPPRLKVPTYGKNYDTGKYTAYTMTFEKCKNK